jgi:4-alpha-glucanotransferase
MTDPGLIRRAEDAGITPWYVDWRGERVQVSDETLAAILKALDDVPGEVRHGPRHDDPAAPGHGPAGPVAPAAGGSSRPRVPARSSWGFTVQLYSLRSAGSWGHGDLRDLADLAGWSARDLGAGFVLVNPLHAAEPLPPVSPSPYLPMTRRYVSPLYLRVEDIPEYRRLENGQRQRIEALAAPLRARNASAALIDRDAVWAAKRQALEIIYRVPLTGQRREAYSWFRRREGRDLQDWVAWCTLAEQHGPDWRCWPAAARASAKDGAPAAGAAASATGRGPGPVQAADPAGFHAWLQWLADEQLAAAQQAALAAGMDTGIITDLAVGAHPGGADAWAHQDLLVSGLSVGAPPDEFNQLGQDWTQPPWHPGRLAAVGYRPLQDLFGAALRHSGGMRADHVMGLMRLWCMPRGMPPDHGAYLRYDHQATVAALAGQAARAGALAIGEDLGTVEPWVRRYLVTRGILGTSMLWFERGPGGVPLPPARWRRACMAMVGTHDMPPAAAFLTGDQVTVRARLGLLKLPEEAERAAAAQMLSGWLGALRGQGLLPPGREPEPDEFTAAVYGYLARTPALLIGVSLADAVGDRRIQNVPGTTDQYPNWRIPLCDAAGDPVLLEDLRDLPLLRAVAGAAASRSTSMHR